MQTISGPSTRTNAVFRKVAQNLYRLESSGGYYALFKRSGKQIRLSLSTSDAALARRRLAERRTKVDRLNLTKAANKISFPDLAERWLSNVRVNLKPSSAA